MVIGTDGPGWSAAEIGLLTAADELEIAVRRPDGTLRPWLPVWVVCVDDRVHVRTWHRRGTGWFGHVLATRRASVRVPGLRADVVVEDVGADGLRAEVDAAYRAGYGRFGESGVGPMVTDAAAATTLRLHRAPG